MIPKIILEGPDNSGKTTLARYLVDSTGCALYHAGGPPIDAAAETRCLLDQSALLSPAQPPAVLDRITAISQQIYSPDETLDRVRRQWVSDAIAEAGTILVYCRPPTEWLSASDRFTWREEEPEEHRQKIIRNHMTYIARYDRIMAGLPKVIFDFKSETLSKVHRNLFALLMRGDRAAYGRLNRIAFYSWGHGHVK